MKDKACALKIIFWISLVGVVFSGYMSYFEIFRGMCGLGTCRIDLHIATIPACVYGFFLYLAIMILSCCGMKCGSGNSDGDSSGNGKNLSSRTSKKKKA